MNYSHNQIPNTIERRGKDEPNGGGGALEGGRMS